MIIVDIETTGLDPARHGIISIGAVNLPTGHEFYDECRPWKDAEITDEALAVNGFTREQCADLARKPEGWLIQSFDTWAQAPGNALVLANHNIAFDVGFLQVAYRRYGRLWPFGYKTVDIHAVAYVAMLTCGAYIPLREDRTSGLSLDRTLAWLGLPPEAKPHNALTGAKLAAEALQRLTQGSSFPGGLFR